MVVYKGAKTLGVHRMFTRWYHVDSQPKSRDAPPGPRTPAQDWVYELVGRITR